MDKCHCRRGAPIVGARREETDNENHDLFIDMRGSVVQEKDRDAHMAAAAAAEATGTTITIGLLVTVQVRI
jgi:hypothetical protein